MLNFINRFRRVDGSASTFSFSRPLVVLQSDDWGRVGIRDREGDEELQASGIQLGKHPYDSYSLETSDDVLAVKDVLKRHRDCTGRSACMVMNFVVANVDFSQSALSGFRRIHLKYLYEGLPGKWLRPGLFEAYRDGIADGVFYPALHGLTHFCHRAVERSLRCADERGQLLQKLWRAETPYIYWRMPWVGYEYCNPGGGFLRKNVQAALICEAAEAFKKVFFTSAVSACAPGYRSNADTHRSWAECGIRVAQNGSGARIAPNLDEWGLLNLYRTVDFEPAQRAVSVKACVQRAERCFERGLPAVVSVHSINFHSTLKDYRGPTLRALDQFLSALETKYPDLLYVNDGDLYEIVNSGRFNGSQASVSVRVQGKTKAMSRRAS